MSENSVRVESLIVLQEAYPRFVDFLEAGMEHMGFSLTDIQRDIGLFLEMGPKSLMVQAEREIAKTTITGLFAV